MAPGWACSPKARPRATVCSGLVEMCVAMNEEGFDSVFIAEVDAGAVRDFSDAG
jgi:hypothetical protein